MLVEPIRTVLGDEADELGEGNVVDRNFPRRTAQAKKVKHVRGDNALEVCSGGGCALRLAKPAGDDVAVVFAVELGLRSHGLEFAAECGDQAL